MLTLPDRSRQQVKPGELTVVYPENKYHHPSAGATSVAWVSKI
jgi:hypothetical protein